MVIRHPPSGVPHTAYLTSKNGRTSTLGVQLLTSSVVLILKTGQKLGNPDGKHNDKKDINSGQNAFEFLQFSRTKVSLPFRSLHHVKTSLGKTNSLLAADKRAATLLELASRHTTNRRTVQGRWQQHSDNLSSTFEFHTRLDRANSWFGSLSKEFANNTVWEEGGKISRKLKSSGGYMGKWKKLTLNRESQEEGEVDKRISTIVKDDDSHCIVSLYHNYIIIIIVL
ncbi:hypothetical protein WN51_04182 [Melipona quadrifasciata]|uniref:Uncharacterized protein n=1 Tax=Melipona quadrifasciata TaxID=166423 RepID=A0A0M8ZWS2_9HYME|nr:hypothetical protein WN51_04182 [Melipona quadrifasciata]